MIVWLACTSAVGVFTIDSTEPFVVVTAVGVPTLGGVVMDVRATPAAAMVLPPKPLVLDPGE